MRSVTFTAIEGIPLIAQGDNLGQLICSAMMAGDIKLARGDILVVCQKIISKAEGRTRELNDIEPSAQIEWVPLSNLTYRSYQAELPAHAV